MAGKTRIGRAAAPRRLRLAGWLVALQLLGGCVGPGPPLPPPSPHPNGQALWRIVHDQCVPDQQTRGDPSPCALVSIGEGVARGFAVLKDRAGATQYLLMPTARITGVEDPALLAPGAINYFAAAWDQRGFVERRLGRPLDRTELSVAVNSIYGRSQDQLHLHIDCVDRAVAAALRGDDVPLGGRWATIRLAGRRYRVRWLDAGELRSASPFELVAGALPGARARMGAWTLALVGGASRTGAPGFYLLADRADPARGDFGSAEELQDHACRT